MMKVPNRVVAALAVIIVLQLAGPAWADDGDSGLSPLSEAFLVVGIPVVGIAVYWIWSWFRGLLYGPDVVEDLTSPEIDKDALIARAKIAFWKLRAARAAQDLSGVRAFLSDGVHERFALQIMQQKAEGRLPGADDRRYDPPKLDRVRCEGGFEVASVYLNPGLWKFVRRQDGQKVADRPGLFDGHCPNCGVAVEVNAGANCGSCGALLRSGSYDWVVADVCNSHGMISDLYKKRGVAALRRRDPQFSQTDLEDRAAVIFWRWVWAWSRRNIDPLRKVAGPALVQRWADHLNPATGGSYGDLEVGAVEVLGILPVRGEFERALVQVKWELSAHGQDEILPDTLWTRFKRFVESRWSLALGPVLLFLLPLVWTELQPAWIPFALFASLGWAAWWRVLNFCIAAKSNKVYLLLGRSVGVLTNPGHGLSSAHCPRCGAPPTVDTTSACERCGIVLNDGLTSWVLMDLARPLSRRGRAWWAAVRYQPVL
jgi:hypothetical protein